MSDVWVLTAKDLQDARSGASDIGEKLLWVANEIALVAPDVIIHASFPSGNQGGIIFEARRMGWFQYLAFLLARRLRSARL